MLMEIAQSGGGNISELITQELDYKNLLMK